MVNFWEFLTNDFTWLISLISTVLGLILGFLLSILWDWWKKRGEEIEAKIRLALEVRFNCNQILWAGVLEFPPVESLKFQTTVWESFITLGKLTLLPKEVQAKTSAFYNQLFSVQSQIMALKRLSKAKEIMRSLVLEGISNDISNAYEIGSEIIDSLQSFIPKASFYKPRDEPWRLEQDIRKIETQASAQEIPGSKERKERNFEES